MRTIMWKFYQKMCNKPWPEMAPGLSTTDCRVYSITWYMATTLANFSFYFYCLYLVKTWLWLEREITKRWFTALDSITKKILLDSFVTLLKKKKHSNCLKMYLASIWKSQFYCQPCYLDKHLRGNFFNQKLKWDSFETLVPSTTVLHLLTCMLYINYLMFQVQDLSHRNFEIQCRFNRVEWRIYCLQMLY